MLETIRRWWKLVCIELRYHLSGFIAYTITFLRKLLGHLLLT